MKQVVLIALFTFISLFTIAETTIRADFYIKYSCSQKFGLSNYEGQHILTVIYDNDTIKFNTSEGQAMKSYSITKQTDKYVIGKDSSGNYSFFDINKKQFYYIDYFMSRHTTAGNGPGHTELKQTVLKMMDLIKEGKTQKDVIQHLITQTEYDF